MYEAMQEGHYKDVKTTGRLSERQIGNKQNTLCFTLKWIDEHNRSHRQYVDYVADEIHDQFFSAAALVNLFTQSKYILPYFADIDIGGDNGMCIASTLFILQTLGHMSDTIMKLRIVPLYVHIMDIMYVIRILDSCIHY